MAKDKNNRILLFYTGGTIGSTTKDIIEPVSDIRQAYSALNGPNVTLPEGWELEIHVPFIFMSEDIVPSDWVILAKQIYIEIERGGVIGVLVLHGTDTLSYTATALSFALRDVPVPIVITGASLPPDTPGSDAQENYLASLSLVIASVTQPCPGIFVVFKERNERTDNRGGTSRFPIFRGSRFTDRFFQQPGYMDSMRLQPIGKIVMEEKPVVLWEECASHPSVTDQLFNRWKNQFRSLEQEGVFFERQIYYFQLYPGFRPELLSAAVEMGARALILDVYHSGTICGREDSIYNILEHLERVCTDEQRSPYIIINRHELIRGNRSPKPYSSEARMQQHSNVIMLKELELPKQLTTEALIVKTMWALSPKPQKHQLAEILHENIAYEYGEEL